MQYQKRSVNGDAGEYLVAYIITHKLGFPCRLYGVDLGVDAEMEIVDEHQHSTGDIIKIQVKTVDSIGSKESASIYIDDRHIDYWKRFCFPVIMCCVDLSETKIYWKQIITTKAYKTGGESKKITFCLKHDILDEQSIYKLCQLVYPPKSKNIGLLLEQLIQSAERLPSERVMYGDFKSIDRTRSLCDQLEIDLKKVELLISNFPWRVSLMDMRLLNNIKSQIQGVRNILSYCELDLIEGG